MREFGTTTSEIKVLTNWLLESGCEMIAMESTGVFWKPLYNLFELTGLDAMIVIAAHMKALPGRKTDIKDAEWVADLLRHGLLRAKANQGLRVKCAEILIDRVMGKAVQPLEAVFSTPAIDMSDLTTDELRRLAALGDDDREEPDNSKGGAE